MNAAAHENTIPTTMQTLNGANQLTTPQVGSAHPHNEERYVLVIGGAGFIGSNLAHRLMCEGKRVLVFDSLARAGVEQNLQWLRTKHGERLLVQIADLRNTTALASAVRHAQAVFHLGAQVAVTTSLDDPLHDFAINAEGTLHLLELLRKQEQAIPLVFTSTNKVYGALSDLALEETELSYRPVDPAIQLGGVSEARNLAFHSPYGCSKGAADQYVLDYAHTFGLPATVFRMSCIYGPRQFGTEDQGWVAHFLRCAMAEQPITIYGDGKQVRDVLFIDDLVNALLLAQSHIHVIAGEAFNIGGGPRNAISLRQLVTLMEGLRAAPVKLSFGEWRPGDQRYYVSDTRKFQQMTGWRPQVRVKEGLLRLHEWLGTMDFTAIDNDNAEPYSNGVAAVQHPRHGKRNGNHAVKEAGAPLAMPQVLPPEERIYADAN